jgi:hypothetical protein
MSDIDPTIDGQLDVRVIDVNHVHCGQQRRQQSEPLQPQQTALPGSIGQSRQTLIHMHEHGQLEFVRGPSHSQ